MYSVALLERRRLGDYSNKTQPPQSQPVACLSSIFGKCVLANACNTRIHSL